MSGRGNKGGRGPGNRGVKSNSGRGPGREKPAGKKSINDYVYYVGSSKQASDYEVTTKFLINHIMKTFEYGEDIAEALTNLEPINLSVLEPTIMKVSTAKDDDKKEAEMEQFKI